MAYFKCKVYGAAFPVASQTERQEPSYLQVNSVWFKAKYIPLTKEEVTQWKGKEPIFEVHRAICERCGTSWVPRTSEKPIHCPNPKCRSAYWDRTRKQK